MVSSVPASAGAPPLAQIAQDEILTGEAVALDVQPVGYFMRVVGTAIDIAVSIGFALLFIAVILWVDESIFAVAEVTTIIVISLMVFITVILPTTVETVTRGRSVGKLAVGARIVRTDGGASGFRQAFIRALVGVLEVWMTFGGIAGVVGAFTPRSQRLGDLIAGTYAERTRAPRLPPPAGGIPAALAGWAQVADIGPLPDRLARRAGQFVRGAATLDPPARARAAERIAAEARPFVSPVPPADPETFLRGVVALRREREYAALTLQQQRVDALVTGTADAPRGFPER
ncbi:RDD family protein [Microbacterium sp.]|uniref:RDD family protein n=1 Tax=Microbacterium sp. TaxID=51671 RepID=UPI003A8B71B6